MTEQQSLTNIKKEVSDKSKIFDAVFISACFLFICWMLFFLDAFAGFHLKQYGMLPRTLEGLRGIVTMHFLHADWNHIAQNSLGFLVLNSFLFYFYRDIAWKTFFAIFFFAPVFVWLFARSSNHIGASLLIYGLFSFLITGGLIRKNPPLMRVALVVITYYGSLIWYIFPIEARISYEGHASGLIVGVVCAVLFRKQGPQRKVYQFETEPELPDDENAYWKLPEQRATPAPPQQTTVTIKYHYKEKESGDAPSESHR